FRKSMHPLMNKRVGPDQKHGLLFVRCVQGDSFGYSAGFSLSGKSEKERVNLADLVGFQAHGETCAGAIDTGDRQWFRIMVDQLNRPFLGLTSTGSYEKCGKGLGFNQRRNLSADFESDIADARILELDLNETFILADGSGFAKAKSQQT